MKKIKVEMSGDIMMIGEEPRLIVNLKTQMNYIESQGKRFPYKREVALSDDLLAGKRKNVYETVIKYYYDKACEVADGMRIAESYRSMVNTTVREIK